MAKDNNDRVLLFRFAFPLLGHTLVDEGESFAQAARREPLEETGIAVEDVVHPHAPHQLSGAGWRDVSAEEHYFLVRTAITSLSQAVGRHWSGRS